MQHPEVYIIPEDMKGFLKKILKFRQTIKDMITQLEYEQYQPCELKEVLRELDKILEEIKI